MVCHRNIAVTPTTSGCPASSHSEATDYTVRFDLDLLGFASKSERPITFRVFLSFAGSDIPSKAELDFHGLKPYLPGSRRTLTPSFHVPSMRLPTSLKPANPFISSRTTGATSATASRICSTISFCSRGGMPKLEVINFSRVFPGIHVFLPVKLMPGGLFW